MTEDRFWGIVEDCRRTSRDVFSFDERLITYLTECDYPTIVAFYYSLGRKTGEYPNSSFRQTLRDAGHDYSTDNSWQRYMGWLVAQGREFYEAVLDDPDVALNRLPESEDYQNHELVIFAPYDATERKAGGLWDLSDVLADYGTPLCPTTCEPHWRTALVVGLAQAAYEEESFVDGLIASARLAVLSDALEEAGCTDTDLLGHLRDSGPHLRGCWAVELLLAQKTPLPMPVALPMWGLASLNSTRQEMRALLGEPHYVETDPTRTCGGEEDAWAFTLPSGLRTLITFEPGIAEAAVFYCDPPDLAPLLHALGIAEDDPRLTRFPKPFAAR